MKEFSPSALSMALNLGFLDAHSTTLSRATYRAMRKAAVAASVADTETMAVPERGPNSTPADMVSGMAGMARISRTTYMAMYSA